MNRAAYLGALMPLLGALPALADELTLRDAVAASLSSSQVIRAAEARVAAAGARIDEVKARTLPEVSLGLTPIHLGLLDPAIQGFLANLAPGLSPNLLSETINVSQVLYDGGRSALGNEAAHVGVEMASLGVRQARQTVAFDAASAYLGVLRAQSLDSAARLTLKQANEHLKDAQLREKNGVGTHFETLQGQTALSAAEGRTIQSANAVRLARLALETAIHEPLGTRTLEPAPVFPAVLAADKDIQTGLRNRTEAQMLQRQQDLDGLTSDIASRARLPVAAVSGIVVGQGIGSVPAYVLLGSVNWTLFDGGKVAAQERAGRATLEADRANLSALEENMRLEVQKGLADRDEAKARMASAENGLVAAQAGFDLAQLRYAQGAGTGTEVVDATSALSQAQSAYIQASYDATAADLRLARALGIDLSTLLTRKGD